MKDKMRTTIGNLTIITALYPSKKVDSYTTYCYVCNKNPSNRQICYDPETYFFVFDEETLKFYYPGDAYGPNYTLSDIFVCNDQDCLDMILLLNAEKI